MTLNTLEMERMKVVTITQFDHIAWVSALPQLFLHLRNLCYGSVIKFVVEFWHADAAGILFVGFGVLLCHYVHFKFEGAYYAPLGKFA